MEKESQLVSLMKGPKQAGMACSSVQLCTGVESQAMPEMLGSLRTHFRGRAATILDE